MGLFNKFFRKGNTHIANMMEDPIGIEEFYSELNKYVSAGVFKEIFSNENMVICNVLNQYYASFNLEYIKKHRNNLGIIMNSTGVRLSIEDEKFWFQYVSDLSDDLLDKRLIELRDEYLKKLIQAKPKYVMMEPSENIDLSMENNIKDKSQYTKP